MPRFGDDLVAAIEIAERWAIHDPDPVTRGQVDALVDAGDPALMRLFDGRLAFGTAGLRAPVGFGPNRMNALVVRQTTAAVVEWLISEGAVAPKVVIGFDARHDSASFAAHAAAAVRAGGGVALVADGPAPTPVMAHALLVEAANAAIVITASHNPPADNGYKLYLEDGLQLVAPADAEIAAVIDACASAWSSYGPAIDDAYAERDSVEQVSVDTWIGGHRAAAVAALFTAERGIRVAYTPLHGVGGAPIREAFQAAGFDAPLVVDQQFEPDGDFPTVSFPNPEEPGAFDLVQALAVAESADVAMANDPDADRLACAVPSRQGHGFTALSGNELGVLLADHVLSNSSGSDRVVARSVVSSRQLDALARAHDVACEVTLTGFKWVARPIITHAPARYVFGYEEAIGYCIGDRVRDKDGITAALVAAEMFAGFSASGSSAWQRLDELAAQHGVFANHPISVRFDDDPSQVSLLMDRFESHPPVTLAGSSLVDSGPVGLGTLPSTAGLHLLAEDDTQVIVRPSGTEPKIKAYIEVVEPVVDNDIANVADARTIAATRLSAVVDEITDLLAQPS